MAMTALLKLALPKLNIIENRTEEQLRADNDTSCVNCKHRFPDSSECAACEQPHGPFTVRSNWIFNGGLNHEVDRLS